MPYVYEHTKNSVHISIRSNFCEDGLTAQDGIDLIQSPLNILSLLRAREDGFTVGEDQHRLLK